MRTLCVSWDPDGLALRKKGAPQLLGSAPCLPPSLAVHLVPVGIWRPTADQCSYFLPTTWQDEGCDYFWASFSQFWHHSLHLLSVANFSIGNKYVGLWKAISMYSNQQIELPSISVLFERCIFHDHACSIIGNNFLKTNYTAHAEYAWVQKQ